MNKQATALKDAKQSLIDRGIPLIEVDEHGYVALLNSYGSDQHIVDIARLTSSSKNKEIEPLIRYLMRNRHTSPFEFAGMTFEVALPIFVERQWIRHRTGKTNEVSARYSELPGEIWELPLSRIVQAPKEGQSRQGSGEEFEEKEKTLFRNIYEEATEFVMSKYKYFMGRGMAGEIARTVIPISTYTRKAWSCDLHNLLHFLSLRIDAHAQKEIQNYANAVASFTKEKFPLSYKAFEDYRLNAVTFSAMEIEILNRVFKRFDLECIFQDEIKSSYESVDRMGKTEKTEFINKLRRIFQ